VPGGRLVGMRAIVVVLTVTGGALPIVAAVWAWRSAVAQRGNLASKLKHVRQLQAEHQAWLDARAADPDGAADEVGERSAELDRTVTAILSRRATTYGDLPIERELIAQDVVAEEIVGFRRQGFLAVVGIFLSTGASVWSLFVPPAG